MRESNRNSNVARFIKRVELVQKKSIMYYQKHSSQPFLKIVVALPTMVASCRGKMLDAKGELCFPFFLSFEFG